MGAEPLKRLVLGATSVVDDIGYVALGDLFRVLGKEPPSSHRVIGGHMVTALAARWGLGGELHRETADTDLGIPPLVLEEEKIVDRLIDLGYTQIAGDRLVTTEVPGLATALKRPSVRMTLVLHRFNGEQLEVELSFPDEVSALVLKSLATLVRSKATDIVDVWRCLEVALAAGVEPGSFSEGDEAAGAAIVRALFATRDGPGMSALISEQNLSEPAADERFTRLRGLVLRVLGRE